MNSKLKVVLSVAVLVIATTGAYIYGKSQVQLGNAGPTNLDGQEFLGGIVFGRTLSTSTTATTQTLLAQDLVGSSGFAYDTILFTPNTGDITLTLPASSTLRHFLPLAGQRTRQCWVNASTTAGIDITFAAGTGIDLEVATSSSISGAFDLTIAANGMGCFEFVRGPSTASAFDIRAGLVEFSDGD